MRICKTLFGIQKNRVMFISFSGKAYADNPKAISEALHDSGENAEIVWAFQDVDQKQKIVPDYVRIVDVRKPLQYHKMIATSRIVVNNFSFTEPKSKGQRFIQTWHGDRAFKKILYDAMPVRKREISESFDGYCDLAIAGSDYGIHQFRSAFRYNGEILRIGTPRDDALVRGDPVKSASIRNELGVDPNTKILLYAPTLRWVNIHGRGNQQIQDIDIGKTLDALEKHDGCKWICLMRAHPNMSGLAGFDVSERIMDVSRYEDMADLLLVSDMLITDYSSCAGDFALTHRPIILYQSDRQEYQEKDREFYFNMEDSPYMIAENQQELEDLISRLDDETVRENCDEILRFYNTTESGEAAAAVARRIVEWINEA